MIDIHAHILPDMDDGSSSMDETLDMLDMAVDSGVEIIAATSHGNVGYFTVEEYMDALNDVRAAVKQENIPIEIVSGMEIFASEDMVDKLDANELLTLNQTRNVLVEFSFTEAPWVMQDYLRELIRGGYRPVVAHPERYVCIQEDPSIIHFWSEMGCIMQCNKGSFQGRFGEEVYHTVMSLMEHNLVHVVGSDAHSSSVRTPSMYDINEILCEIASPEVRDRVLLMNPGRILHGEDVIKVKEIPY